MALKVYSDSRNDNECRKIETPVRKRIQWYINDVFIFGTVRVNVTYAHVFLMPKNTELVSFLA